MNTRFFSHIRNGLVALGVLAGLSVPAAATPLSRRQPRGGRAAVAEHLAQTSSQVSYRRDRCYDR